MKYARLIILLIMGVVMALVAMYGPDQVFALMPFNSYSAWNFWYCLGITILTVGIAASYLRENTPQSQDLAAYSIRIGEFISIFHWFVYTMYGHHVTWFLDIDRVGWFFVLVDIVISGFVIGLIGGYGLSQFKFILSITKAPFFVLLSILAGMGWIIVIGSFLVHFFDEHPLLSFFILVTAIPSGYAPVAASVGTSHNVPGNWDTFYSNGQRYFGRPGQPSSWTKMPC